MCIYTGSSSRCNSCHTVQAKCAWVCLHPRHHTGGRHMGNTPAQGLEISTMTWQVRKYISLGNAVQFFSNAIIIARDKRSWESWNLGTMMRYPPFTGIKAHSSGIDHACQCFQFNCMDQLYAKRNNSVRNSPMSIMYFQQLTFQLTP